MDKSPCKFSAHQNELTQNLPGARWATCPKGNLEVKLFSSPGQGSNPPVDCIPGSHSLSLSFPYYRKSSIKPPGGLFISSPFEGGLIERGGGGLINFLPLIRGAYLRGGGFNRGFTVSTFSLSYVPSQQTKTSWEQIFTVMVSSCKKKKKKNLNLTGSCFLQLAPGE